MNTTRYLTDDMHIALQSLAARVDALEARLAAATPAAPAAASVADDYDLDSPYGDPEVRRDPPRWKGEPMAGKRYSQTSSAFLECIAGFLDWAASQADAKGDQMIEELIKEKNRCEQSLCAARKAAAELEKTIGFVLTVPCERYEEAENAMLNAIEASVAARLAAALHARILRERAVETSAAIADGRIAVNEAARACAIAVDAAVSAGVAEMEARRCGRAEVRAHDAVRDRMQDRKGSR